MSRIIEPWEKYYPRHFDFTPKEEIYASSRRGRLFHECLYLSPSISYVNATRFRVSKRHPIPPDIYIPSDIEYLKRTTTRLGFENHASPRFKFWWKNFGINIFKGSLSSPETELLGTIGRFGKSEELDFAARLNEYRLRVFNETKANEVLLIAVPLRGRSQFLLQNIGNILKEFDLEPMGSVSSGHVVGLRFQEDVIKKRLRLLWMRAMFPELAYHKLGADAGISNKYPNWESLAKAIADPNENDPTTSLAKQTIRTLREAVNTIENAARGRFPDHSEKDLPDDYDYKVVLKHIIEDRILPRIRDHEIMMKKTKKSKQDTTPTN